MRECFTKLMGSSLDVSPKTYGTMGCQNDIGRVVFFNDELPVESQLTDNLIQDAARLVASESMRRGIKGKLLANERRAIPAWPVMLVDKKDLEPFPCQVASADEAAYTRAYNNSVVHYFAALTRRPGLATEAFPQSPRRPARSQSWGRPHRERTP